MIIYRTVYHLDKLYKHIPSKWVYDSIQIISEVAQKKRGRRSDSFLYKGPYFAVMITELCTEPGSKTRK